MRKRNFYFVWAAFFAFSFTPIQAGATSQPGTNNLQVNNTTRDRSLDEVYRLLDEMRAGMDVKAQDRAAAQAVKLVVASSKNGEVKTLYLRELMQFTQSKSQQKTILKELGNTRSYKALLYASSFLNHPELKKTAAQTVSQLVLSRPDFLDEGTKPAVEKVCVLLSGSKAKTLRQLIDKQMRQHQVKTGFVSLFNGKDLAGWKGLVANPIKRLQMSSQELAAAQVKADAQAKKSWVVENGVLVFTGKGDNLCTVRQYGDFEMLVDWKLHHGKEPDAGIYLRGTPQVQIWDTARVHVGAQVGSGGLYNNKVYESKPLKVADERVGEWNTFRIKMIGDRVTVWLNGELVVNNVVMENYWDRKQPIPSIEQIELQAHGSKVSYRDIYIREIPRKP
ncbi:DUF1080 domain-containing protein [Hoylesella buccalis]|uniref:3-keto-disaccharide hydrolase n=1 Tax=Hoylesella buccalis TaxID=28127 RepID=UPI0026EA48CC|nr:DUF1080 domain-containing protein [Hoylesella buccalis]